MIQQKATKKKKGVHFLFDVGFLEDFDKVCERRQRTIVVKKLMSLFIRGKIKNIDWNEKW